MKTRDKLGLLAVGVVLVFIIYTATSSTPGAEEKRIGNKVVFSGIEWYTSVDEAISVAKSENKPVFIFFHAEWCKYCQRFKKEVYPNPEVKSYLTQNFIPVAIDIDRDPKTAARFGVSYPPQEVVLSPDGREIARLPGFPSRSPVESFLGFLKSAK